MFSTFLTRAMCQNSAPSEPTQAPQEMGLVKSLVAGRTIAAASAAAKTADGYSCEFGSLHYFALCGAAGN